MTSATLRDRLHSLWYCLTDPNIDRCLDSDLIVPSKFLTDNNIDLTLDDLSFMATPEAYKMEPPFLFESHSSTIIMDHPIDLKDEFFTHAEEAGIPEPDPSPVVRLESVFSQERPPFYRGCSVAHYIDNWVMGGYPRQLPLGVPNLASFCGIGAVADPHALNTETCGLQRSGPSIDIQWETYIYEYGAQTPIGTTRYPHLILLGAQSCNGKDNSICLGELTTIVTAMRCRAYQPAIFDENAILVGDVEQSVDGNPMPDDERELVFKNEKRFPVIMVSLVGPQHYRFIYACMDGSKLYIKMSPCHKIVPENEATLHGIAGVLLSDPLVEDPEHRRETPWWQEYVDHRGYGHCSLQ